MIHYHGCPLGGPAQHTARFFSGRHAIVSFARPDDLPVVADVCQSFVLDNGAFTAWKKKETFDFNGYVEWARLWARHPGMTWALIPDVIDGSEQLNDDLLLKWPSDLPGVPVWHLHESIERLEILAAYFPTVALGSSGVWAHPGSHTWWGRMGEVMNVVCDAHGRPPCRLHGLRMLAPKIFSRLPFASADSTNAAMNAGSLPRFGIYQPPSRWQRAEVIAERIEASNSAPVWVRPS